MEVVDEPVEPTNVPTPIPTSVPATAPTRAERPKAAAVASPEAVQAEIVRVFGARATVALCIAKHESGYRAGAVGYNEDARRTHDRGVFQINSYWHREVSDAEAYDASANIRHAYRISKSGTDWHQWTTRKFCGE